MRLKVGLPFFLPGLALGLATLTVALVLGLALRQPWLGMRLVPVPGGGDGVQIAALSRGGPAEAAGLLPGQILTRLGGLPLMAEDLREEPDMIEDFAGIDRFLARQEALSSGLRAPAPLRVIGAEGREVTLPPLGWRPAWDLPAVFWGQLFTGLFGFLFGAWLLSLRRDGPAEAMLCLAGVGLMLSAHAAAIYSTRELALPAAQFRALSAVNHLGALIFGMGMVGLFLCYPLRLVARRWLWLPVAVLTLWWLANQLRLLPDPGLGFQLPVVLTLLAIAALVLVQLRRTKGDPRARAALRWMGLSVLVGAGAFVVTVILPQLMGFEAVLSQGAAFLFFLPIYGGLALGVARYRLFELQDWAFRILFYMCGMILLVLLDAALIALVALERAPAFGVSLLLVALFYLPLRDWLTRRLFRQRRRPHEELYRALTAVTLTPGSAERQARWTEVLREEFAPLELAPLTEDPGEARLAEEGAALELPGVDTLSPMRLLWAQGGRALFGRPDLDHAGELVAMLRGAAESRHAYEAGVAEERARIARDMHDNIGIQLTGALHSSSPERKDALIREALSDLRTILSNADRPEHDLELMLADLRASLAEHVTSLGMAFDWQVVNLAGVRLPPREAHALRSVLREAVGNALRHSGGSRIRVRVALEHDTVWLLVEDDGMGMAQASDPPSPPAPGLAAGQGAAGQGAAVGGSGGGAGGHGLSNMRARVAGFGGTLNITDRPGRGVRVSGDIPIGGRGEAG